MADVLQPIADAIVVLQTSSTSTLAELHKLADKIVNAADPAEVATFAQQIKDVASAQDAAVQAIEVPAPTA